MKTENLQTVLFCFLLVL